MRTLALTMGLAMAAPAAAAAASKGLTPYGAWARDDGVVKVVIRPCAGGLCATNTWIRPGETTEKVGDRVVLKIQHQNGSHWAGTAFDPKRAMTFDVSVDIQPSQMQTSGCVVGGTLCKSMAWTRISGN